MVTSALNTEVSLPTLYFACYSQQHLPSILTCTKTNRSGKTETTKLSQCLCWFWCTTSKNGLPHKNMWTVTKFYAPFPQQQIYLQKFSFLLSHFSCFKVCFTTGHLPRLTSSRRGHSSRDMGQEWEGAAGCAGGSRLTQQLPHSSTMLFQSSCSLKTWKHSTILDYHHQKSYIAL